MDIKTKFLGLDLNSPVIVGSSHLSTSLENIEKMEKSGAGAVVLKSVLEEEIICSNDKNHPNGGGFYGQSGENYDYVKERFSSQGQDTDKYLEYIRTIKERFSIPVIASISCTAFGGWVNFVQDIKDAGCDAVELNFFTIPSDTSISNESVEKFYNDTLLTLNRIGIPIMAKVGNYFTDMAKSIEHLSMTGVSAITLLSKTPYFDIDIDTKKVQQKIVLSSPSDLSLPLMWTSLLSKRISCDISATGGVCSSEDVIKLILAGATTVQVVSCLYRNGIEYIETLNKDLLCWMEKQGYNYLEDFRGTMAVENNNEAKNYPRMHYIKTFTNIR